MTYDDSVYQAHGYENREEYLDSLRDEYGATLVNLLLTVLPQEEDFDGLVTSLEDQAYMVDLLDE